MGRFLAILTIFSTLGCATYDEPKYEVVKVFEDTELRRYEPYVVAEVVIESQFHRAGSIAHRKLFKYISGDNQGSRDIPMATPVEQQGTEISMATPVEQVSTKNNPMAAPSEGKYKVRFVMPNSYKFETLPKPNDPDIEIVQIPSRDVMVRRFSGRWTDANYRENEDILFKAIEREKFAPKTAPVYARFNPPFTIWFLRRNEVQIEVEAQQGE